MAINFSPSQQSALGLSAAKAKNANNRGLANLDMGMTATQEEVDLRSTIIELEELAKKSEAQYKKKQRRSGIGRLVGAVAGTLIGAATKSPKLGRAAYTAIGGAIGGKIGQGGDIKTKVNSAFVPGGVFYANDRKELKQKAEDFNQAINEINKSFDTQIGMNFVMDFITGAAFAKAGEFVPEGGNFSLDELYKSGDISFKDYIKNSISTFMPGGINEENRDKLIDAGLDEGVPVKTITVAEQMEDLNKAAEIFDKNNNLGLYDSNLNEFGEFIELGGNDKLLNDVINQQGLPKAEFQVDVLGSNSPLAPKWDEATQTFVERTPLSSQDLIEKNTLAKIYDGEVGDAQFDYLVEKYNAIPDEFKNQFDVTMERFYKEYQSGTGIGNLQFGPEDFNKQVSNNTLANVSPDTLLSPGNDDWLDTIIPKESNTSSKPFVNTATRSPEERGIIDVDKMNQDYFLPESVSQQINFEKRATDFNVPDIFLEREFNIQAGNILYDDIGLQTGWADSTVKKAKADFRKARPDFKGPINNKTVLYEEIQPFIEKYEAGKYGEKFVNKGGDAGVMGFSPDWYKLDGAYRLNKDKTESVTWKKIHALANKKGFDTALEEFEPRILPDFQSTYDLLRDLAPKGIQ